MNDPAPDYTRYTLNELKEARTSVDAEQYPGRAEAIDAEILRRAEMADTSDLPPSEVSRFNPVRFLRGVAIVEIVGGVIGIGLTAWWCYVVARTGQYLLYFLVVPFAGFYTVSVFAGILLWRLRRSGFRLSLLTQGLQIAQVTSPALTYAFVVAGGLAVRFGWGDLGFNFWIGSYFSFYINQQGTPTTLAINVVAVLLFLGILKAKRSLPVLTKKKIMETFE